MTDSTTQGRPGKRTREQRIREMLRRSKSATNKYGIGGREKTGSNKPKPITLAKVSGDGEKALKLEDK